MKKLGLIEHIKNLPEHDVLGLGQETDRCKNIVSSWSVVWDAAKPVRLLLSCKRLSKGIPKSKVKSFLI